MQNLEGHPRTKVGGHNLNYMRNTNDTVLIVENKEDLQQVLDIVRAESKKKRLELNSKKAEVMVVSKTMSVHRSTYISMGINSSKGINSNTWVL